MQSDLVKSSRPADRRLRVGVVVSGQLTQLASCTRLHKLWLQRMREDFDVDAFVHSWGSPATSSAVAQLAGDVFAPRAMSISDPWFGGENSFSLGLEPHELASRWSRSFVPMCSRVRAASELLQQAESDSSRQYDFVIRTRPDAIWSIYRELHRAIRLGESLLPRRLAPGRSPHDIAAVLLCADADGYFTFADHFASFFQEYAQFGRRSSVAEYALRHHLASCGVKWRAFDSPVVLQGRHGRRMWEAESDWRFFACFPAQTGFEYADGVPLREGELTTSAAHVRVDLGTNLGGDEKGEWLVEAVSSSLAHLRAGSPLATQLIDEFGRFRFRKLGLRAHVFVMGFSAYLVEARYKGLLRALHLSPLACFVLAAAAFYGIVFLSLRVVRHRVQLVRWAA